MTREQLIEVLKECQVIDKRDPEDSHSKADNALIAFINDPEVTQLYDSLTRWCA